LTVDWWLDERRDPYLSTVAAARYFKILYDQFGDWQLALAAYNAGEGSVSRAMAQTGKKSFKSLASSGPLKDETKHYVPKFLAMLKILKNAKKLGFQAPSVKASKDLQEVRVPGGSDLAGLANHLGLSWEQFHAINPAYRRQVSPPDRTTAAWLPKSMTKPATAWLDKPDSGRSGPGVRLARAGESWWTLSRETGIPAAVLREANKNADSPSPGKPMRIPLAACSLDGPSSGAGPREATPAPAARAVAAAGPAGGQAAASVPAGPAGQPALYVVRSGDTLASVARKTGVSESDLASFNKANPKDALTPGTPLLIPAKAQADQSPAPAEKPAPYAPEKPAPYTVVKRLAR
jgi:membrane-bound lytic murein transglycosylase D